METTEVTTELVQLVETSGLEKAKKDAEIKAAAELKAKQQAEAKAAKAPIKQQLNTWVDSFSLGKPIKENETTIEIEQKFEAFRNWAKTKIEAL